MKEKKNRKCNIILVVIGEWQQALNIKNFFFDFFRFLGRIFFITSTVMTFVILNKLYEYNKENSFDFIRLDNNFQLSNRSLCRIFFFFFLVHNNWHFSPSIYSWRSIEDRWIFGEQNIRIIILSFFFVLLSFIQFSKHISLSFFK